MPASEELKRGNRNRNRNRNQELRAAAIANRHWGRRR
jgi:hypothetical protein